MRSRGWIATISSIVAVLLLGSGCSTNVAHLTVVSTKNVDLSGGTREVAPGDDASNSRFWLLFIPFAGAPSIGGAINSLLEEHSADYLVNADIVEGGWSVLLFSYGWVNVKGDVWQTSNSRGAMGAGDGTADADAGTPAE